MRVFIIKHALEDGKIVEGELIEQFNLVDSQKDTSEMRYVVRLENGDTYLLRRKDFAYSYDAAAIIADRRRRERIEELKNQIKTLRRYSFDVKDPLSPYIPSKECPEFQGRA